MEKMRLVAVAGACASAAAFVVRATTAPQKVDFRSETAWAFASAHHVEVTAQVVLLFAVVPMVSIALLARRVGWQSAIVHWSSCVVAILLVPAVLVLAFKLFLQ